jgi:hypothetical protein
MIPKRVLNPQRIRRISGSFSFIPHRLITDGFVAALSPHELLLYFFLILVSDRHGLSYYAYDSICSLLAMTLDQYIEARNGLIQKDLIAFDGRLFQVLELPGVASKSGRQEPLRDKLAGLIRKTAKGL